MNCDVCGNPLPPRTPGKRGPDRKRHQDCITTQELQKRLKKLHSLIANVVNQLKERGVTP